MQYTITPSFHSYMDTAVLPTPGEPGAGGAPSVTRVHTIIRERTLSYRFSPHFHPYATELVKRLVEKSIPGLQSIDTEYLANADGTRAALPDSTRATLAAGTHLTLSDGTALILPRPLPVTLPDGTGVRLSDGTQVTLPGSIVWTSAGAIKALKAGGTPVLVPDGSQVVIPSGTVAAGTDGSALRLAADAHATLNGALPRPVLYDDLFTAASYAPTDLVRRPYPVKDLDFGTSGAYAIYNRELFYHIPVALGLNLTANGRFEEAQRWLAYVFDPTDDGDGPPPQRFWKVRWFQESDVELIESVLMNLSTGADPQLRQDTINSIEAWKNTPFNPHVVARYRSTSYMFKAVMAYLDNLVAWGDSLFQQDTRETINEATQLYVEAANILGPRPQDVPSRGKVRPQTYAGLRADLDAFGNAMRSVETEIPFDLAPHPTDAADGDRLVGLRSLGNTLYFCVPRNDKLLSYWDVVADRLFKIHNSLNIQGIFRQLPLFAPPIDPALLARLAAAGLSIEAIVSGANQPLPLVRFAFLIQKALEICQEVKSLGGGLLAAIEKEDNEGLAILRARHERAVLDMAENTRYAQLQQTIKEREGLERSLALAIQRYAYYERLLGRRQQDIADKLPQLDDLDLASLVAEHYAQAEADASLRDIAVDIAQGGPGAVGSATLGLLGAGDITGGKLISSYESEELDRLEAAQLRQDVAAASDTLGSVLSAIPQVRVHAAPVGVGTSFETGGAELHDIFSALSSAARGKAGQLSYEASRSAKMGSYDRRQQEWTFQSNLAAGEIAQILTQRRAAQLREAIAQHELDSHRQQVKQAEEIEFFLSGERGSDWLYPINPRDTKTTNQAFYAWMRREIKGVYAQSVNLALDTARKAERAVQHELGDHDLSFIQYDYMAGKEGLLAGEKLFFDLKRMEMAYHDLNRREYELNKHVSLLQMAPHELLRLRATGRCTVSLSEELFDLEAPGHYFRRLKSVAVSIPCVTGPYSGVSCTLTLLKSSIRTSATLGDGDYARTGADDARFSDNFGSLQSIVTSTGQSDSGLFETNLHDERYLPFEGSGAVSQWQLSLPSDLRQFDYDTIADVILHLRYTAREGGDPLRNAATANLVAQIDAAQAAGTVRLFSARHDFPMDWAKFKSASLSSASPTAPLTLTLREEHYPFWSAGHVQEVRRLDLFAETEKNTVTVSDGPDGTGNKDTLVKDRSMGDLRIGKLTNVPLPAPIGPFTLNVDDNSMSDLWLTLSWGQAQ